MNNIEDIISKVGELKVTELAELVKAMETKFGVSAAMPMAAAVTFNSPTFEIISSILFILKFINF